jgi:hypothetical protein
MFLQPHLAQPLADTLIWYCRTAMGEGEEDLVLDVIAHESD